MGNRHPRCLFALSAACLAAPAVGQAQVQTTTESFGYMETYDYAYDGRRNDSFQTNIIGIIDGQAVAFDLTFNRAFEDPDVVNGLAGHIATRGVNVGGAPGVLTWGDAELVDFYEEFLDSFTETSYSTVTSTVVTTQLTSGDAPNNIAFVGDRGYCYSFGVTGETNFGGFDGFFADCDTSEEFEVAAGTVNTNTHTTTVVTTLETSFTNEDYLNYGFYQYTGTVTLIGAVHTAVQSGAFEAGTGFRSRLLGEGGPRGGIRAAQAARAGGGGSPVRFWFGGHGGESETPVRGAVAGSRRSRSGLSGGVVFAPAEGFALGLALDRTESDIDAVGAVEAADFELTQYGLTAAWEGEAWFVSSAAMQGRGRVDAAHGTLALGGASTVDYSLDVQQLAAEAGYRFRFGRFHVAPLLGADWQRVRTGGFAEQGGVALAADGHGVRRSSAWAGLDAGHEWRFGGEAYLQLGGRLTYTHELSGDARALPVTLVGAPGDPLRITGATDEDSHVALVLEALWGISREAAIYVSAQAERHDGEDFHHVMAGVRIGW